MEFCPECGTVMMPKQRDGSVWLVCSNCDFSEELKQENDYKIGSQKKKEKKPEVAVIEKETVSKHQEPDYDLDLDAYEEIYDDY